MHKTFADVMKLLLRIILFVAVGIVLISIIIFLWLKIELYKIPITAEIEQGEFPFTLTYEISGQEKQIEDTIICDYVDFHQGGMANSYIEWNMKLDSGNRYIMLADTRNDKIKGENGEDILGIVFLYGNANYYMGDKGNWQEAPQGMDEVYCLYSSEKEPEGIYRISPQEALDKYNIRLVNWECAPPIDNSFARRTLFDWNFKFDSHTILIVEIFSVILALAFIFIVSRSIFKPKT